MTKTLQASTTIRVRDPAQQILEFGLMGIGVLGVAVASLGILLFKRRRKSNFKTI